MAGVKGFGSIPDLNFRTLCCRGRMLVNQDCKLTTKSASIKNLTVENEMIINGTIQSTNKLLLDSNVIVDGIIYDPNDEFTRISYITQNLESNIINNDIIISPIEGFFDPTSVKITMPPCDGVLSTVNPINGNVLYRAVENILGEVDVYQYSIDDVCGNPHCITQYVCRKLANAPFINNKCINVKDVSNVCIDISDCIVTTGGIGEDPDLTTITVTRIEEPNFSPVTMEIEFTDWEAIQYMPIVNPPNGIAMWTLTGNTIVTQENNAQPVTQLTAPDLDLCEWNVEISATPIDVDDDFIGFTIGYNIDDDINPNADYLVVRWDGILTSGGSLSPGTKLFHQQGLPTILPGNGIITSWDFLGGGLNLSTTPWVLEETHVWRFEYCGGFLNIYIDDELEFSIEWFFPNGANFGLWVFSQAVRYEDGTKWTNVCCPCTSLIADENWVTAGNVVANIEENGVVCITTDSVPKAIRLGLTVDNLAGKTSPETLFYVGFSGSSNECFCEFTDGVYDISMTDGLTNDVVRIRMGVDNKMYVLLRDSSLASTSAYTVRRYNPDGSLDTTYGTSGILQLSNPTGLFINVFAVLSDFSFVFGRVFTSVASNSTIWKCTPAGLIDTAFATSGYYTFTCPGANFCQNFWLSPGPSTSFLFSGTGGFPYFQFFLKFIGNGPDPSFNGGSIVFIDAGFDLVGSSVYCDMERGGIFPDGSVYGMATVGTSIAKPFVVKLTPSGVIDVTYGTGIVPGYAYVPSFPFYSGPFNPRDVLLPDNSIIHVGWGLVSDMSNQEFTGALKFTPNGELDTTWGDNGTFTYANNDNWDFMEAYAAFADPCGGVVIVGQGYEGGPPFDNIAFLIKLDENGMMQEGHPLFIGENTEFFEDVLVTEINNVYINAYNSNGGYLREYLC